MLRVLLFLLMFTMLGDGISAAPSLQLAGNTQIAANGDYQYWYYRNAKVYYDINNRVYYYRDKNRWRRVKRLPRGMRLDSYRVTLRMRSSRPYYLHSRHVRRYPPRKGNVTASRSQTSDSSPNLPQNGEEAYMWYSPAKKVFYNTRTREYAYLNRNWRWQRSRRLPSNIKVDRYPKIPLRRGASMPKVNERFNTRKVNMVVTQYRTDKANGGQVQSRPNKYVSPNRQYAQATSKNDQEIRIAKENSRSQASVDSPAKVQQKGGDVYMWYSPAKKVFYNEKTKEYAFLNRSWRWQRSKQVPSNMKVERYPKIPLGRGASMPKINERFNTRKVNMIVSQHRLDKPNGNQARTQASRNAPSSKRYPAGPNPGVMYTYHFYPNSQVYHDPYRRIYFYQRGKRWVTNTKLPEEIKIKGDYVKLNSEAIIPYKQNGEHRKQYPPR